VANSTKRLHIDGQQRRLLEASGLLEVANSAKTQRVDERQS